MPMHLNRYYGFGWFTEIDNEKGGKMESSDLVFKIVSIIMVTFLLTASTLYIPVVSAASELDGKDSFALNEYDTQLTRISVVRAMQ